MTSLDEANSKQHKRVSGRQSPVPSRTDDDGIVQVQAEEANKEMEASGLQSRFFADFISIVLEQTKGGLSATRLRYYV